MLRSVGFALQVVMCLAGDLSPNADPRAVASGCYGQHCQNVRADSTLRACIRSLPLAVLHLLPFRLESANLSSVAPGRDGQKQ
jgi:hypothetical protein